VINADYADYSSHRLLFTAVADNMRAVAERDDFLRNVERAIAMLVDAMRGKKKLLVFGNGGSDAEHIAAEFVCRFAMNRPALPAIALSTNDALVTATSNDLGFEEVFARQVDAFGQDGDVAWGISTSGASANVIRALQRARARGMRTIGLCGAARTEMADHCEVLLDVPLDVTARIQEVHLVAAHIICGEVERRLFAVQGSGIRDQGSVQP
jgi:D-sedoheptulose 7-phosphate isomerase